MKTECSKKKIEFQQLGKRNVVVSFDGGKISSDGGSLLLGEVEKKFGVIEMLAKCFIDHRKQEQIEHTVYDLVAQRIYGLALAYEDLNDHDELRKDPLLATLVGKSDPTGQDRVHERDKGKPLAGKSTLNRLELSASDVEDSDRYKKIPVDPAMIEQLLIKAFFNTYTEPPKQLVLDLDATDDPLHGKQEGAFYHGYYREYCYLPLYIFCDDFPLCAKLRTSNIDASKGVVDELRRIVAELRKKWPSVEIIVRGDSGFCREELMRWCEENNVDFVIGLATNSRLSKEIELETEQDRLKYEETRQPARFFKDFCYSTLESWSCERRVVAKAEHLPKGENPRFIVSSILPETMGARELYEEFYCARGEMENRIKEQQLYLFADRTSSSSFRTNQLRLWFSTTAYIMINLLRRFGLKGTEMAKSRCDTIRLKLLKIGAQIRISVRNIWISLSESFPYKELFESAMNSLRTCRQVIIL